MQQNVSNSKYALPAQCDNLQQQFATTFQTWCIPLHLAGLGLMAEFVVFLNYDYYCNCLFYILFLFYLHVHSMYM